MRQAATICTMLFFIVSCDFNTAEYYFNEADKLSEQGKHEEAILLLDKAIEKDPKYIGAYINRGYDKLALRDFKSAIEDYNKVLEIDSANTMALFNIGNNYKRLDDYKTDVDYYNKAFGTKGGQMIYIDWAQNDFFDLNNFDVPGYAINYERGIAYYRIDSLQRAFEDFNAAIRQHYMTAECYYWIGYIYVSIGQTNLAREYFMKSTMLGDKDAEQALKEYCSE
jgi:tetratricopeptide (TPR) repeat protein